MKNILTLTSLLMLLSNSLFAQLEVMPLAPYHRTFNVQEGARTKVAASTATIANLDTLQLPFWDDFSFSGPTIDTALWQSGPGIFVNPSIGINQPTINVATFDGINAQGRPYTLDSDFVLPTDSLVSQAIDLSSITDEKRNTVFFSFFWQMQGLGELPDENDSLRVDFLNLEGNWVRQWSVVGTDENLSSEFQQVYIQLLGQDYLHEGFRFKFQSYGNSTGAFDAWHIDYVYLNQDRTNADESIFDHAIVGEPLSLFNTYTSIPYSQLFAFPDTIFASVSFELSSFETAPQPGEYNYIIRDKIAQQDIFFENEAANLAALGRRVVEVNSLDKSIFNPSTDSLWLESEFQYVSGDGFFIKSINNGGADTTFLIDDSYNFRANDTIRKEILIHDVLSYDDGSAEFAAGIRGINGQLAVEYVIAERDTITAIDINFPIIRPLVENGDLMRLWVYRKLSEDVGDALGLQDFQIIPSDTINEFNRYTFETPIVVEDTFYISFQQFRDDVIGIGLDKTNNQGNKIFFNVAEAWEPNLEVEGSLMMRPIFGKTNFDPNAVLGIKEKKVNDLVKVYPNPSTDLVYIQGEADLIQLFSMSGQEISIDVVDNRFSIFGLSKGVYVLKARLKDAVQNTRLFIR